MNQIEKDGRWFGKKSKLISVIWSGMFKQLLEKNWVIDRYIKLMFLKHKHRILIKITSKYKSLFFSIYLSFTEYSISFDLK